METAGKESPPFDPNGDLEDFRVSSSTELVELLRGIEKAGLCEQFVKVLAIFAEICPASYNQQDFLVVAAGELFSPAIEEAVWKEEALLRAAQISRNARLAKAHTINDTRYHPREKCPDCGKIAVDPDDGMPVCPQCFDEQMAGKRPVTPLARPQYRCVVCGQNWVDADGGYDTCEECLKRI